MTLNPTKVVYIASQERSGSTLISQILGQVPGFFSVGELYIIWRYGLLENRLCGCGDRFHTCPFWQEILAASELADCDAQQLHNWSRQFVADFPWAILPGLSAHALKKLEDYPTLLARLYGAIAQNTQSRVLVDASKSVVHYFMLSQLPEIDLYMVHLTRDPHGVEYSISKRKQEGIANYVNHNVVKGSLGWMLRNLLMEHIGQRQPDHYLRVSYEDFVNSPQAVLAKIATLIQEDVSDLQFSDQAEFKVVHNHVIAGSPNRFRSGTDQLKLDETWKQKMDHQQKQLVSWLTRPLLKRYGYSSTL